MVRLQGHEALSSDMRPAVASGLPIRQIEPQPEFEATHMIKGVHTMFYSSKPEALRAFLRDRLGFSSCTDVGGGWLIFDLPEADMGVHPSDERGEHGEPAGTHDISFYCDDIRATVAELEGRGVEFDKAVADGGFGLVTCFTMPGGVRAMLFQPHYRKHAD